MGTTAEKLNYLLETKEAIKGAIKAKGVEVSDSETFRSYADKVKSIKVSAPMKDVNFFDSDGTILYSYETDEFLELSSLPEVPDYDPDLLKDDNPVVLSWNNTLEEIKEYVNTYGGWDVGLVYSAKYSIGTYLFISISDADPKELHIITRYSGYIKWGDGTRNSYTDFEEDSDHNFYASHTYQNSGDYIVYVSGAWVTIQCGNPSRGMLRKVFNSSGNNSEMIFQDCYNLTEVHCAGSLVRKKIQNCNALKAVVLQNESDTIEDCVSLELVSGLCNDRVGANMQSLRRIITVGDRDTVYYTRAESIRIQATQRPSVHTGCGQLTDFIVLGNSAYTYIQASTFDGCRRLRNYSIPQTVTRIYDYAFRNCSELPIDIPSGVVAIGIEAFKGCYGLKEVNLLSLDEKVGAGAFRDCVALKKAHIALDNSGVVPAYLFKNCRQLSELVIVDAYSEIGYNAFDGCKALKAIELPSKLRKINSEAFRDSGIREVVLPALDKIGDRAFEASGLTRVIADGAYISSIGDFCFTNCYGLGLIDFRKLESIPTLAGFGTLLYWDLPQFASDTKIVVPDALYDEWIVAEKWSTYADRIVKASEYNG